MTFTLTPEQQKIVDAADEDFRNADKLPPPSKEFQAKMDSQAVTNAELGRDSTVHDEVMDMPHDQFAEKYADVLNANAYDEDEGATKEP